MTRALIFATSMAIAAMILVTVWAGVTATIRSATASFAAKAEARP